jgi:hypothetical protein
MQNSPGVTIVNVRVANKDGNASTGNLSTGALAVLGFILLKYCLTLL